MESVSHAKYVHFCLFFVDVVVKLYARVLVIFHNMSSNLLFCSRSLVGQSTEMVNYKSMHVVASQYSDNT